MTSTLAEPGSSRRSSDRGRGLGADAGLIITSALVLVVANLVDLSAIASVGSARSLIIFPLVGVAGYRRRADTGGAADYDRVRTAEPHDACAAVGRSAETRAGIERQPHIVAASSKRTDRSRSTV